MAKFKVLILIIGGGVVTGAGVFLLRETNNEFLPLPPTCTPQAVVIALEREPLPDYYRHTTDFPVVLDFKKMNQAVVP
jgi:hypothetical protein